MKELEKQNKEDFGNFTLECEAYFVAAGHKLQLGQKLEKYPDLKASAGKEYKKADLFFNFVLNNCKLSPRATKRIQNLITFQ